MIGVCLGLSRTDKDMDQWHMSEDKEVKVGTLAGVHQPRHSIRRLAVVNLAGLTPTETHGEGRLIELATH